MAGAVLFVPGLSYLADLPGIRASVQANLYPAYSTMASLVVLAAVLLLPPRFSRPRVSLGLAAAAILVGMWMMSEVVQLRTTKIVDHQVTLDDRPPEGRPPAGETYSTERAEFFERVDRGDFRGRTRIYRANGTMTTVSYVYESEAPSGTGRFFFRRAQVSESTDVSPDEQRALRYYWLSFALFTFAFAYISLMGFQQKRSQT